MAKWHENGQKGMEANFVNGKTPRAVDKLV